MGRQLDKHICTDACALFGQGVGKDEGSVGHTHGWKYILSTLWVSKQLTTNRN